MPRSIKLSWQPGSRGKPGYWKKFYMGKVHYFPSGSGKSDMAAYDAAWAMWEQKKAEIDRTTPRKYQQEYELAIDEWEQVLAWSNRHGEKEYAEIATRKLESLRKRLASLVLPPLDRLDRLDACLGGPLPADPKWLAEIHKSMEEEARRSARERLESYFGDPETRTPKETEVIEKLVQVDQLLTEISSSSQGPRRRPLLKPSGDWFSPGRIKTAIWQDRLGVEKREAASEDQSLKAHIERYVGRKEKHGKAGQITRRPGPFNENTPWRVSGLAWQGLRCRQDRRRGTGGLPRASARKGSVEDLVGNHRERLHVQREEPCSRAVQE